MQMSRRLPRWTVLFTTALTLFLLGCRQEATDMRVETENALRQADADWAAVAAKKDWNTFLTYYSTDATVLAPNMPMVSGTDAIEKAFDGFTSMPNFSITWHDTKSQAARSGDGGYTLGNYEMSFNDPAGKPVNDKGKYVSIWAKQPDGKWKVVVDMFNSDLPAVGTESH